MSKQEIYDFLRSMDVCRVCVLRYMNGRCTDYLDVDKSLREVVSARHMCVCLHRAHVHVNMNECNIHFRFHLLFHSSSAALSSKRTRTTTKWTVTRWMVLNDNEIIFVRRVWAFSRMIWSNERCRIFCRTAICRRTTAIRFTRQSRCP